METEYIILKEATLNNNCPECYSKDGMVLSFKQKRIKSKLLVKTNGNIIESIECNKCENKIFPGQWTIDIERVYDYHRKTITRNSPSIRFTSLFYILLFLVLIFTVFGYIYISNPNLLGLAS